VATKKARVAALMTAVLISGALGLGRIKQAQAAQAGATTPTAPGSAKAAGANGKADEKPAEAVFKNIQVLTGQPASQVRDSMKFMSASLGVRCGFCHVNPFPSDAKENKKTARKMIRMVFAINRENFNGRPEVTCYSCHQGQEKPVSTPRTGTLGEMFATAAKTPEVEKGGNLPTASEVIARYEKALGGAAVLGRITTRVSKGVESEEGQPAVPVTAEMKTSAAIPVAGSIEMATERGMYTEAFDGTQAWSESKGQQELLSGFWRMDLERELELNPVAVLRSRYTQARVAGMIKLGIPPEAVRQVYVLEATAPNGALERFYFDAQTGLLARRTTSYQTFLGAIPLEADYSDYRAVDGVQVAFTTAWWAGGDSSTVKLIEVKNNAPVVGKRFEAATAKPQ
jgi:hypothetical protein